jgi:hypothetical protein
LLINKINMNKILLTLLCAAGIQANSSAQCAAPIGVTASSASICAGTSANLNATAPSASIKWYTVPSAGTSIGSSASGANFTVSPALTTIYYAETIDTVNLSTTFNYTGSLQSFVVPVGVTSLNIEARGAQGGSVSVTCTATGGLGAQMKGDFAVTAGQVFKILVGEMGLSNGSDAGGGGGSFIADSVSNNPLIIAGGGGGATNNINQCGSNLNGINATITTSGTASGNGLVAGGTTGNGGGASFGSGGGGGGFLSNGVAGTGFANNNGKSYLNGGASGAGNNNDRGGYGGGGAGWFTGGNGGGGGGYSGGATSGSQPFTGGGGGGSYNTGTNQVNTAGVQTGNGQVIITYFGICTSTTRTPVTVTVNALPIVTASATNDTICAGQSTVLNGNGALSYTWNNGATNGVAISPIATTTYTVTGTDANTCSSKDSITIKVNTLPIVVALTTNDTICSGQSVILNGSGALSYTWNNGATNGVAITPNATTTYTVTGTDVNACFKKDSVTIRVNVLPIVIASATNDTICAGQSTVLSGNGALSYAWNNGATNVVAITPNATTTYTVIGTDANTCSSKDSITIKVNTLPIVVASTTNDTICVGQSIVLNGNGALSYTWNNGATNGVAITPNATTTYTVTGTDVNACSKKDSITITVNALPTVTTSASAPIICAGQSTILTGGGAVTYVWNNGATNGVAIAPSGTTTYTVTGTDANACSNTATQTITVNANPVASLIASVSVLCAGTPATLTGLPVGGTYSVVSGATSALVGNVFNAATVGPYTIAYTSTNASGCSDSAQFNFNVNCVLGLDNTIINNSSLTIFPNPNNGIFTINSTIEVEGTIELINELGQVVYKNRMNGLSQNLDVQNMAAGIYHLRIINGNISQMKRLSIVK